jgi:flavonol synthase
MSREVTKEYAKYMRDVVDKLFTTLSLGLGLEGHVLKEAAGGEQIEYMLKINYYPPCPRPDLTLGVVAHTDLSAITILVPNEVPGLQIFKDDHWIEAKYIPDALIIHIGDQIEVIFLALYLIFHSIFLLVLLLHSLFLAPLLAIFFVFLSFPFLTTNQINFNLGNICDNGKFFINSKLLLTTSWHLVEEELMKPL